MTDIAVRSSPDRTGWVCVVDLRDADGSSTQHRVSVTAADLGRLDPGASDPDHLLRRSFAFLLAREPKESILASFDLPLIGRYFPDFEAVIRSAGPSKD